MWGVNLIKQACGGGGGITCKGRGTFTSKERKFPLLHVTKQFNHKGATILPMKINRYITRSEKNIIPQNKLE